MRTVLIILLIGLFSLCFAINDNKQSSKSSSKQLSPKSKSKKQCPATYQLTDSNINELGDILRKRSEEKPSGIEGQYSLLLSAIDKGINGPLKALAEDILNCFGENSGCKKGCDSFSKRLYGADFEPNDSKKNMKRLKYLTFWSGTSFAKKQSEKLANQTNSEFIDMCAGTVAGELLTGWNKRKGSGKELNEWFQGIKNGEEIDLGAGNQNLWTPMSKVLADKWFRPGINAVGLLDYYRKTPGNYFHNDEMPLLTKKQTDKNRLVIMIHKGCAIIEKAIKHVFGPNIDVDTDELSVLNLKNGCPHRHCIGGYKSSNFDDAANAPVGSAKRVAYDKLDAKFKKAFKGHEAYYTSAWKKSNWLIFAFKEKEILCTVGQIREFVLNRRDKGLTSNQLSNIIVGEWQSNDDEHLRQALSKLVRVRKSQIIAGRRRAPPKRKRRINTRTKQKKSKPKNKRAKLLR